MGEEGAYENTNMLMSVMPKKMLFTTPIIQLRVAKYICNLFPCNECAKTIIQNGIKEIIYESDKYADIAIVKASKKLLRLAGLLQDNILFATFMSKRSISLSKCITVRIFQKFRQSIRHHFAFFSQVGCTKRSLATPLNNQSRNVAVSLFETL